jgi:hypothetical protein
MSHILHHGQQALPSLSPASRASAQLAPGAVAQGAPRLQALHAACLLKIDWQVHLQCKFSQLPCREAMARWVSTVRGDIDHTKHCLLHLLGDTHG